MVARHARAIATVKRGRIRQLPACEVGYSSAAIGPIPKLIVRDR